MNSRERIAAALSHMTPDRTPIFEYILLPPLAETLLGRNHVEYTCGNLLPWLHWVDEFGWEKAVYHYAVNRIDMAIKLGHDLIFIAPCPGSNYSLTHVDTKANPQNEPTDPIERILERNRLFEQNPGCFGDDAFLVFRLIREEMARRDLDLPILAPACLHGVWTDVDLMQTMLLEPAIAHRHFTLATDRTIKLIDQYQRHGVEQVSIGGDFAGNRLVI
jgi:hypothetical protein